MMKSRAFITVLLCFILITMAQRTSISQEKTNEAWIKFKAKHKFPGLQVVWDKKADVPKMIIGLNLALPEGLEHPEKKTEIMNIVLAFLEKNKELLQIPLEAVKEKKIWKFQSKWYVTLQTYYKGIPIYQGQVGFTLDERGKILTYASDYNPKMEVNIEPAISKDEAVRIAFSNHKPELELPVSVKEVYLMICQNRSKEMLTSYVLTWYVFLRTKAGHLKVDRVFVINAQTGQIIQDFYPDPESITGTIRGEIYPEHSCDTAVIEAFEHEEVSVAGTSTNTNTTGNYSLNPGAGNYNLATRLEGPFVRVQCYNMATATDQDITHTANVTDPGTSNFTWNFGNSAPDDGDGLNVFWHANRLHDEYYQAILGINWTNNWTGTNQMTYSVNRGNINNAFAGNPITIYSDAVARSCDITYHETTHNVLYDIFGGSYIGWPNANSEGYAFDEGFADYVACSFLNDSAFGEFCAGAPPSRNCDNNMQYSGTGYNLEGHTGGQLISGVAWDLWNKEGLHHNAVDVLLFAGLSHMATGPGPYFFSNPNQRNYLESLLTEDDNNNNLADGTPHDREIFQAFRNHDLLPVDGFCKDSPQDDGNVPSSGQHWTSPDIWVRNNQDGGTTHQNPIYSQTNYIYIRVRNLGYLMANIIKVKAYWADPAGSIPWPSDWNFIGETNVNNLADNSETVAGPIIWAPTGTAMLRRCLLVRLECPQDMMTEEGNVKQENNIAQKNIFIIPPEPSRPGFSLSIHSGIAIPTGSFANDFGRSWSILLNAEYHFTPQLSLVGLVGYNDFKSKTTGVDDTYWFNFSVNLRYYQPLSGPWSVYIGAGPGIYRPKIGDSEFGANAGFGVDYEPISRIVFELGVDYHMIFDADIQFVHIHAGVVRRF